MSERSRHMGPISSWAAVAASVVVVAAAAVGCGGTGASTRAKLAASGRAVPNPFTVVARYSDRSLGLDHPEAFAIGHDGDLYVTDASQRVTVISPDGKVLRRWGKRGSAPGEFNFVSDVPGDPTDLHGEIAVGPTGLVYVSDGGNDRVEVFTSDGHFVRQFGSLGAGKGQFISAYQPVVDSAGNVYVLDDQNVGVVQKFSPSGKFVWRIGGPGSPDPDLASFHHMETIDSHGRLVMTSDDTGHVIYVDGDGHKLDSFDATLPPVPPGAKPCDVSVDPAGNAYVTVCSDTNSCPTLSCPGTLVFDRTHHLIAVYPRGNVRLFSSPKFGPRGEAFALGLDRSLIRLRITVPQG
jgi:DNA-binding beta-propeller fold protein YncE